MSWCRGPLQDFLHFPKNVPVRTGVVEINTGDMGSEVSAKWQEWADQLISVEDGPDPHWSKILANVNAVDAKPKVSSSIQFNLGAGHLSNDFRRNSWCTSCS